MAGIGLKLPQGLALVGVGFLLAGPGALAQTNSPGARPEARDGGAPAPPGPYRSGSSGENQVWNKRSRGGYPYQQLQKRRLGYPQGSRSRGGMGMGMQVGGGARDSVPPPPPSGAPRPDTRTGTGSQAQDRRSTGFGDSPASEPRQAGPGERYKSGNRQDYRGRRGRRQRGQEPSRQGSAPRRGGGTSNRGRYRPRVDQGGQLRRQPQYGPSFGRHEERQYSPDHQRAEQGGQRPR